MPVLSNWERARRRQGVLLRFASVSNKTARRYRVALAALLPCGSNFQL